MNNLFFDFSWNQNLRALLPDAAFFFRYITEFGSTLIYMGVFFILFWGVNKDFAKKLLLIYISSNFINYYAKSIIGNSRPDQSHWLLIDASHLSTPSGHAMSSTVVWGYLGVKVKNLVNLLVCVIVIILVGLSRMYLGVHWFGDVLTGWCFGVIVISGTEIIEQSESKLWRKYQLSIYIGISVFGFIALIFTEMINISSYSFGTVGGQFIGIGVGFFLENKYVNFNIEHEKKGKWKIIMRVFIGILIVAILYLGLYLIVDADIFWQVSLQYIIVFIVGICLWPYIFKKVNL
jgi:hypothetical protein